VLRGATGDIMGRGFILIAIMLLATMSLSACGKRGALEAPALAPNEKAAQSSTDDKPGEKTHRPFILDSLLQ
jgi:predicted small lipoprotein YifL